MASRLTIPSGDGWIRRYSAPFNERKTFEFFSSVRYTGSVRRTWFVDSRVKKTSVHGTCIQHSKSHYSVIDSSFGVRNNRVAGKYVEWSNPGVRCWGSLCWFAVVISSCWIITLCEHARPCSGDGCRRRWRSPPTIAVFYICNGMLITASSILFTVVYRIGTVFICNRHEFFSSPQEGDVKKEMRAQVALMNCLPERQIKQREEE